MKAEERARYFMPPDDELAILSLADEFRAHANEALERAWKVGASIETTGKDPQRVQDEMLAAIRALKE